MRVYKVEIQGLSNLLAVYCTERSPSEEEKAYQVTLYHPASDDETMLNSNRIPVGAKVFEGNTEAEALAECQEWIKLHLPYIGKM